LLKVNAITSACIVLVITLFAISPSNSGHIGTEPYLLLAYFIPALWWSVFVFLKNKELKVIATLNITAAITGILLVMLFDVTNMIVQYDRWAKRGLPVKGDISWFTQ